MDNITNDELATKQFEEAQKIQELLKDLRTTSISLAKSKFALARNQVKDTITNAGMNIKDSLYSSAENYGQKLKTNAARYQETRTAIDGIVKEYEQSLSVLTRGYIDADDLNTLRIEELEGQKAAIYEKLTIARANKENFIANNEPALSEELAPIQTEQKQLQEMAITALINGDIKTSNSYTKRLEELQEISNSKESSYNDKLVPFNEDIENFLKEYHECQSQIQRCKEISKELGDNFSKACDEALGQKSELLATVENNTVFDKLKGFLSKTALGKINGAKNFKKNHLIPIENKVKEFSKSVPVKASELQTTFKGLLDKGKTTISGIKEDIGIAKDSVHNALLSAYDFGKEHTANGLFRISDFLAKTADKLTPQIDENSKSAPSTVTLPTKSDVHIIE